MSAPLILITVADHDEPGDVAPIHLINARYADGVRRAGGIPILMSANANEEQRATAFATMDGLLLSGGADIDPARYNEPIDGAVGIEPARDALEWAALDAADRRGIPVFGICRGLQFLNVHRGGSLLQHVEGQVGAAYPATPALSHPLDVQGGTKLAQILGDRTTPLAVNSYHHQAVSPERLAPTLRASAFTDCRAAPLLRGLRRRANDSCSACSVTPSAPRAAPPTWSVSGPHSLRRRGGA